MKKISFILFVLLISWRAQCQRISDGKLFLDDSGSLYLKISFASQFWLRHAAYNHGSSLFGYAKPSGTDVGIRRFRMQFFGQLTDRIFFYSQFGINNFNSISDRKPSFFVHDVNGEISIVKEKLSVGMGLSAWSGLARFASPAVGSIMGLDAPLYQQTTNDVTDQFLRKLGVFTKGKFGILDYRFQVSQPMSIQKSTLYTSEITRNATFSARPPHWQWNGYVQLQLLDKESNLTPYMTGTYLGKKKVFNVGAGFQYQPAAMWLTGAVASDTLYDSMLHWGADLYYDAPLGTKGQALHVYAQWGHLDYGPGYIRNLGVMNPVNGDLDNQVLNGGGVAFPAYGTGQVLYTQLGYKCRDALLGSSTLMPFVSWQRGDYKRLNHVMNYYTGGLTLFLHGHASKCTLAYESRPVFQTDGQKSDRKGAIIFQYQIFY